MAHSIPKRNVHSPAAANAPHISLHNLIRKAGGGGGLISCWCWNVEMLPAATGVTIIRGEATLGCPGCSYRWVCIVTCSYWGWRGLVGWCYCGQGSVMWQVSGGHSSLLGTLFVGHYSARQSRCLATTPPARGLINTGILMGAFKIPSKLVQQRQWLSRPKNCSCLN